MCRKFVTVTPKNCSQVVENLKNPNMKKALIVNVAPIPEKITRTLDTFGACGYDLTKVGSREKAIDTLTGLMSIPENCGKVLCEIV